MIACTRTTLSQVTSLICKQGKRWEDTNLNQANPSADKQESGKCFMMYSIRCYSPLHITITNHISNFQGIQVLSDKSLQLPMPS